MESPKFIFVQPSLREFFTKEYPKMRSFISNKFEPTETCVVVADSSTTYSDKKGVLYIHPSKFSIYQKYIFDFFKDFSTGNSIKKASDTFYQKIEGVHHESSSTN